MIIMDLMGCSQQAQFFVALPAVVVMGIWGAVFPLIAIFAGICSILVESDDRMKKAEKRRKWEASRQMSLFPTE